jgi:hypothetical protein
MGLCERTFPKFCVLDNNISELTLWSSLCRAKSYQKGGMLLVKGQIIGLIFWVSWPDNHPPPPPQFARKKVVRSQYMGRIIWGDFHPDNPGGVDYPAEIFWISWPDNQPLPSPQFHWRRGGSLPVHGADYLGGEGVPPGYPDNLGADILPSLLSG